MNINKTNIGLLLGDPSGIGPELTVKLLDSDISEKANVIVIGEKKILEDGQEIAGKKIGRNEPCVCGSGKKYKHCCGAL